MSENQETIVAGSSPVTDSSGSLFSTTDYVAPVEETTENVGTSENVAPEGAGQNQAEQSADTQTDESVESTQKESEIRFDKHPRFQQLIREKNEYKQMLSELKKEIEELKQSRTQQTAEDKFDLQSIDTEKLLELQTENPKEFLELVTKSVREQVINEVKTEQERALQEKAERERENAYVKYAEEHPDVLEMWENGTLQKFLEENPHHNIISAHMYLTQSNREAELRKQIQAELEEKYRQRQIVRENARVLSNTPSANYNVASPDPEISNTKQAGGLATVLARRLEAMRKQR